MIRLHGRLTRSLPAILLAFLLGGGVVAYCATRAFLLSEFDAGLRVRARSLAALVELEEGRFDFESIEERASDLDSITGFYAYELRLPSGEVLKRSRSLRGTDLPRRTVVEGREEFFDLPLRDGRPGRALAIAFHPHATENVREGRIVHSSEAGSGAPLELVFALDRTDLDAALASFARGIALMESVLLVLVLVVVATGIRHGLAPLDQLATEIAAIEEGSLDRRLAIERQPTELAGIRRRLNELLERMHAGARSGHGERESGGETIELGPMVAAEVGNKAALAREKHVEIAVDASPGIAVASKRPPLETLLRNLIENAVQYALPGSRVLVSARVEEETVLLEVSNEKTMLTEADLVRLFEPSRDGGLGITLGETLARAIEASLRARLAPPGHVTFTLELVRATTSPRPRATRAPARS